MSSNFITNRDKFLSDIINGILPKTDAVDILVGYFYYSGYVQLSEKLKDKQIRILVGLDIDLHVSKRISEVENVRKDFISRNIVKEDYYKQFINLFTIILISLILLRSWNSSVCFIKRYLMEHWKSAKHSTLAILRCICSHTMI